MPSELKIVMLYLVIGAAGTVAGWKVGFNDGFAEGRQSAIDERQPQPPATVCRQKMTRGAYRQLGCVRYKWREGSDPQQPEQRFGR